jgi:Tfp pilus assembly protein PilE
MKISSSSKQQRGLALMEALFVLILAAVASSVALQQYGRYLDNITNKQAAEHATIVADAAAKYLKDNYAAVVAIAGPTSPATITTAMLKTTNYLPSGFSDKNAFGQDYTVRVIEPQPNQLQALVVSTGGQTIRELDGTR